MIEPTQHNMLNTAAEELSKHIRGVPDFPKKGILFRDIMPLIQNGEAFHKAIKALAQRHQSQRPDVVVAIESRGLIFGSALAYELGIGIVPLRKAGKLPHKTYRATYTLEYGQDTLEIHQDAIKRGDRVLLVDDLLATGGTMEATVKLVGQCGGQIVEVAFLIELTDLRGRQRLSPHPILSLIQY